MMVLETMQLCFYYFVSGVSSYNVTYISSDGTSNEIRTNFTSVALADLEPNTTYSVVVEALASDNTVDQTSEPESFTTSEQILRNVFR